MHFVADVIKTEAIFLYEDGMPEILLITLKILQISMSI